MIHHRLFPYFGNPVAKFSHIWLEDKESIEGVVAAGKEQWLHRQIAGFKAC